MTSKDFNTTGKGLFPALYGLKDKGNDTMSPGAPQVAPFGINAATEDELEVPFAPPATVIEMEGKLVIST